MGECGQLGDRDEVATAEPPLGEDTGGMGEAVAVEAVPPGKERERRGDGVGSAAEPCAGLAVGGRGGQRA